MKDNSSHILLYFLVVNLCNTRFPSGCWNPPCLCATAWAVAQAYEAWHGRCSPSSQLQDFTFCINGKGVGRVGISSPPNIQNLMKRVVERCWQLTVDNPKIKSSNSGLSPKLLKLLNREAMKSQRERKGHVRSEDGVSHMPEGQEIRHLNSLITSFSDLNQWHTLMFLQTVLTLQFVCSACWVQLHVIIMEHACVILQLDSAIHSARLQPSHHTSSCRLGRKNLLQVDILLPWPD